MPALAGQSPDYWGTKIVTGAAHIPEQGSDTAERATGAHAAISIMPARGRWTVVPAKRQ